MWERLEVYGIVFEAMIVDKKWMANVPNAVEMLLKIKTAA